MNLKSWIKKKLKKNKHKYVSSTEIRNVRLASWADYTTMEITTNGMTDETSTKEPLKLKEKKTPEEVKPAVVVNQLFDHDLSIDCTNLDKKIKMIKERAKKLQRAGIDKNRVDTALIFLKARKKLPKFKDQFKWKITTNEKIEQLLEKYKLDRDNIKDYHEFVPPEALQEMDEYITLFGKVTGGYEPRMQIILPVREVRKKKKARDPIIIAESPFGNFFFVLGAWDKEIEIFHELWKGIL